MQQQSKAGQAAAAAPTPPLLLQSIGNFATSNTTIYLLCTHKYNYIYFSNGNTKLQIFSAALITNDLKCVCPPFKMSNSYKSWPDLRMDSIKYLQVDAISSVQLEWVEGEGREGGVAAAAYGSEAGFCRRRLPLPTPA